MARGRKDARTEARAKRHGNRVPLGGFRQNLSVPQEIKEWADSNDMYLRFFVRDRVQRAMEAGFSPVVKTGYEYDSENADHRDESQWYIVSKGRNADGSSQANYLMAQPMEFHNEDQALKNAEVDAIEEALRDGAPTGKEGEEMYVPRDRAGRSQIDLRRI